jgi:mRNA-degrading endonuclease RelE of RelBE toxin-antitoxin system
MARRKFELVFAPEALDHLDAIAAKYRGLIEDAIDEQLISTPDNETRNRKPLDQPAPFDATWEIRCGPQNRFRVFYDVDRDKRTVSILAIGVKERNRLLFANEEFKQ